LKFVEIVPRRSRRLSDPSDERWPLPESLVTKVDPLIAAPITHDRASPVCDTIRTLERLKAGDPMADKIIGVVCLALGAASQIWIAHKDTALFYSFLFGIVGLVEIVLGEIRQRRSK